jgi:hypothetical protein
MGYSDSDLDAIFKHLQQLPSELAIFEMENTYKYMGLEFEYEMQPIFSPATDRPMYHLLIKVATNKFNLCGDGMHEPVAANYGNGYYAMVCKHCHRIVASYKED